jgi:flagellar biosynthesis protein
MMEKKGVAVRYRAGDTAPRTVARARGALLEKVLEIARANDITVYRDPDLAETLYAIETGSEIPESLFFAMAEVLAYCYRVNLKFRDRLIGSGGSS